MSTATVIENPAPAEAGIEEARTGKEDDDNAWNTDDSIFDKDEVPVVFPSGETTSVWKPSDEYTNEPSDEDAD